MRQIRRLLDRFMREPGHAGAERAFGSTLPPLVAAGIGRIGWRFPGFHILLRMLEASLLGGLLCSRKNELRHSRSVKQLQLIEF